MRLAFAIKKIPRRAHPCQPRVCIKYVSFLFACKPGYRSSSQVYPCYSFAGPGNASTKTQLSNSQESPLGDFPTFISIYLCRNMSRVDWRFILLQFYPTLKLLQFLQRKRKSGNFIICGVEKHLFFAYIDIYPTIRHLVFFCFFFLDNAEKINRSNSLA